MSGTGNGTGPRQAALLIWAWQSGGRSKITRAQHMCTAHPNLHACPLHSQARAVAAACPRGMAGGVPRCAGARWAHPLMWQWMVQIAAGLGLELCCSTGAEETAHVFTLSFSPFFRPQARRERCWWTTPAATSPSHARTWPAWHTWRWGRVGWIGWGWWGSQDGQATYTSPCLYEQLFIQQLSLL